MLITTTPLPAFGSVPVTRRRATVGGCTSCARAEVGAISAAEVESASTEIGIAFVAGAAILLFIALL
jgi:hypothetical protein